MITYSITKNKLMHVEEQPLTKVGLLKGREKDGMG